MGSRPPKKMDILVSEERLKETFPYLDNIAVAGRTQQEPDYNVQQLLDVSNRRKLTLNEKKTIASVSTINILGYLVDNREIKPDPERLRPRELPPPTRPKSLKRILGIFAYYAKWIQQFFDKIQRLKKATFLPFNHYESADFENIKKEIVQTTLKSIDKGVPFVV